MTRNGEIALLVDTGVLLAAVSPRDKWHDRCAAFLLETDVPLMTTVAVLTELFYFVHQDPMRTNLIWRFLSGGVVELASIEARDLPEIEHLMQRYADRPMDFADATLVYVAGREGIADMLTIDHDDFETYRFGRNRRFRISPAR